MKSKSNALFKSRSVPMENLQYLIFDILIIYLISVHTIDIVVLTFPCTLYMKFLFNRDFYSLQMIKINVI